MRKWTAVLFLAVVGLAWNANTIQAQSYYGGNVVYSNPGQGTYYYEAPLYNYARTMNGYSYYPSQVNYYYYGNANLNPNQPRYFSSNYVPFYYNGNNRRYAQQGWYSGYR